MRQVARRTAEAGAEIDDLGADADIRAFRQRVIGGKSTIVILIVRKQVVWLQPLEGAAHRTELSATSCSTPWIVRRLSISGDPHLLARSLRG